MPIHTHSINAITAISCGKLHKNTYNTNWKIYINTHKIVSIKRLTGATHEVRNLPPAYLPAAGAPDRRNWKFRRLLPQFRALCHCRWTPRSSGSDPPRIRKDRIRSLSERRDRRWSRRPGMIRRERWMMRKWSMLSCRNLRRMHQTTTTFSVKSLRRGFDVQTVILPSPLCVASIYQILLLLYITIKSCHI